MKPILDTADAVRLSIAIVNWNTTGLLSVLLASIRRNAPAFGYEVIVVDNASGDLDEALFLVEFPDVQLIRNDENLGYARGNNQAFAAARGDYILLLNPDTEVTEGAIGTLVGFMESHPDAAAAGAKLVRPDGGIDRSVRGFPYPGPIAWEYIGVSKIFPKSRIFGAYRMTYFNYDETAEVDQPMGSCLIISGRALTEVGVFDEQFPVFFNEVDWLYRAKKMGYRVYFTPDAVMIHHGASSTRQVDRRKMSRESHESLIKFYRKHFRRRVFAPVYYFTLACTHASKALRG
ncbi:MAG: glycosyltransferase family 2 protein [Armatimonadetes bacterium]|nr:glycosyltransferase family 2 protein [Armatimonadota bacterium]